jgi:hypothetical protein
VFRMSGPASAKHCCGVLGPPGFILAHAFHRKCTFFSIKTRVFGNVIERDVTEITWYRVTR